MPVPVDREGAFRCQLADYGLKQMDSGAVAISLRVALTEHYDGEHWQPWAQYDMEAEGDIWIVKKNGEINQQAAESLMRHAGWDGTLESITGATWTPTPFQVTVKRDDYQGNVRHKIAYVNEFDRTPGGLSNVSPDKARELAARFGSQFRAIAGNVKRNNAAGAGTGAPAAPSRPAPPPPPPARQHAGATAGDNVNGDIPF